MGGVIASTDLVHSAAGLSEEFRARSEGCFVERPSVSS